jgi:hypothetical protein
MSSSHLRKRFGVIFVVAILVTNALMCPAQAQAGDAPTIDIEGTEFMVRLPDGRVLRSAELVGTVLGLRSGLRIRIEAVEREQDQQRRPSWLHTFAVQQADGTWANLCRIGPDGRRAGFPIPGRAAPDATVVDAQPGVFEISCTAGAQAKCIRFGYRPWEAGPDGRSLRGLYNACIRMVRADYGGEGHGTTRDGTVIDVYDAWRIQTPDMNDEHDFEAAWGPEGAVCVRHARIKENVSLDELERQYPRLRGRTGTVCTEEFARSHGALLFNRSRP